MIEAQASEEAQRDDVTEPCIDADELFQRRRQFHEVGRAFVGGDLLRLECRTGTAGATARRACVGIVHQHAAHGPGREREEIGTVIRTDALLVDQATATFR